MQKKFTTIPSLLRATAKVITIYGSCLSLIYTPMAFAAKSKTSGKTSDIVDDSNSWVNGINGFINNTTQIFSQYQQQNQMYQAQANLAGQLQVRPLNAMYFPQCIISQAESNAPVDMCESIAVDPNNEAQSNYELAVADQIVKIAEQYDSFYNQLLSDAQNTSNPVGIKCLKDAYRKELDGMQKKLDYLTNLITKVNEMDKKTKAELQLMKKSMDDLNYELTGGTKSKSEQQKSLDLYSKYFNNAACKSAVPSSVFDAGNGVRGVKDFMTKAGSNGKSLKDVSSDMIANETTYKNQVTTQISRMQNKIAKYGIEDWVKNFNLSELTRGGLTQFAGMEDVVKAEASNILTAKDRAANYLKQNVNYTLPSLDNNFSSNVGTFAKESATYFKKKSIESCIKGDLGLSYDQLIALIAPSGQGTRKNVQSGLRDILEQDGFITEKLDTIAAMDKSYGLDKVSFKLRKGGSEKVYTPYTYFKEMVSLCTKEYEDDKTFSATGESRVSDQQKVKQAQAYINEILNLEQSFSSKLAQAIQDEIVNCEDSASGAGSCNEEAMSVESKSFCINTASKCANFVQQCAKHAENVYNNLKTQLETKVKAYNTKIANMITEKNKLLQSEAFKAIFNSEWYGKYFNNSTYKLPENLVVSTPELAMSEYGFMTHGGDSLNFLDSENPENLTAQLEKLKEMITGQSEEVSKVVGDYITAQESAMKSNQEKWSTIKEKCKKTKKDYAAAAQQYNAEQGKKAAEVNQEVNTWCNRYNTRPICGGTNSPSALMEDSLKISSYINQDALDTLQQAEKACLEEEQGMDENKESDVKSKYALLVDECRSSRKDKKLDSIIESYGEEVIADSSLLLEEINDALDDGDQEVSEDELEKFLRGEEPSSSLEKVLKKSQAGKMAITTHSLMLSAKESDGETRDITCGKLTEAIDTICKEGSTSGTCTNAKRKELQESLPSSSSNVAMARAYDINELLESFEATKKKYARFAKSKAQMGENSKWPDCTGGNNSGRRVGEDNTMTVEKAMNEMYNSVKRE